MSDPFRDGQEPTKKTPKPPDWLRGPLLGKWHLVAKNPYGLHKVSNSKASSSGVIKCMAGVSLCWLSITLAIMTLMSDNSSVKLLRARSRLLISAGYRHLQSCLWQCWLAS